MNIQARTRVDGARVWKLEFSIRGRRRSKTVGPFLGSEAQQLRQAKTHWLEIEARLKADLDDHIEPSTKKLAEYAEEWLARREHDLRITTFTSYSYMLKKYILPQLGGCRLQELRPNDILTLLTALRSQGLTRTVGLVRTVLHKALQDAVYLEMLKSNPVDRVQTPKIPRHRAQAYTLEEISAILEQARPRWRPLIQFAAFSGLRISEVLALKWEDVDLKKGYVKVHRSIVDVKGRSVLQDKTKTPAGERAFTLPDPALDALRMQRKAQLEQRLASGPAWKERGFVFTTATGKATGPSVTRRAYRSIRDAAGASQLSFHSLRHTSASIQLAAEVTLEAVSKRLGHGSSRVTADTYSHMLPQMDQDAAVKVNAFLDRHSTQE